MDRFEDIVAMDEEPFDIDLLEEIYVPNYSQSICMSNIHTFLFCRYFELFDKRYKTNIASMVNFSRIIGYDEEESEQDYGMVWYEEAPYIMERAMDETGWIQIGINIEEFKDFISEDIESICCDEKRFLDIFRGFLEEHFNHGFLMDAFLENVNEMREIIGYMEEGDLLIIWNPQLNDYMRFKEKYPEIVAAACKKEDEWIMRLEQDIWEPYQAFYLCRKSTCDKTDYCVVSLGCDGYNYVSFEAINPNWICRAVKLHRMLLFANEKISFNQKRKGKVA